MTAPLFSCDGITCAYDTVAEPVPVIEEISVELPANGFVSLVGPSGVGKTTLFKALAGLKTPDCGRVLLGGEDITGKAGRVGYMPQKDMLFPFRTVLDNTILPLVIRGEKKKAARDKASAYFPVFGLDGYQNRYPHELSGGMRQRAALLRTCMTANKVILLDEPFSALDAITRSELQHWYEEMAARMGLATIFITHDIDEAVKLSDTVYLLGGKPGRVRLRQDIPIQRPRPPDFALSPDFLAVKRNILAEMGEQGN
ncbi:MAG: ABC transporter ATP-binding protein [Spirochaetaceae bacterium]|jgi:ABC-type nitrate/sulfonate/bicarbonate transport system ATPase subunit|nr:ABC transporter ATP-binding protein [Spirochaetaceae bacterium]